MADRVNVSDVSLAEKAGKFLTFKLAREEYGLEILKVQEIIGMMDITRVPGTPEFIRGIVNLRGKIIPVVDLRLKFAMKREEYTPRTCIIVVQLAPGKQRTTIGIIVDDVSEVMDIDKEQLEGPPAWEKGVETDFILGIGKVEEKVVMLLDIDRVLSGGEFTVVNKLSTKKMPDTPAAKPKNREG